MPTHHVPKGVSLDTLRAVIAGWDAVGAAAEPKHTTDVADATGISDAVGRQTRFLEDIGVLAEDGQKHRLTERGQALAGALAVDDDERASGRARELLADWPVTEAVRGVVRGNPSTEDELVGLVATVTGHDPDANRVRSGITTLLALYDWAGLLDRDEDGRYFLPEGEHPTDGATPDDHGTDAESVVEAVAEEREAETDESAEGEAAEEAAVPGEAIEALVDAADASDVESLLADIEAATGADAGSESGGGSEGGDEHALSLEVAVDADPDDLETLVGSIRRGLTGEDED